MEVRRGFYDLNDLSKGFSKNLRLRPRCPTMQLSFEVVLTENVQSMSLLHNCIKINSYLMRVVFK